MVVESIEADELGLAYPSRDNCLLDLEIVLFLSMGINRAEQALREYLA